MKISVNIFCLLFGDFFMMKENELEMELNPFLLFPEEVWEHILKKLEDSKDVENVFKAYVQMEGYILRNKFRWLLHQVLPYVHPWLTKQDLLRTRQVCKRWCTGVDIYLDNHPIRRAYDPNVQMTGQAWFSPASRLSSSPNELWHYFGGVTDIDGSKIEVLAEFLLHMDKHPHGRNPFVGRSVKLDDEGLFQLGDDGIVNIFWDMVMDVIRRFGEHIWFLEIATGFSDPCRFCRNFLDILHFLPNLKSIEIKNCMAVEEATQNFSELWRHFLPPLPKLETLTCTDDRSSTTLINTLVLHSSKQIRRLSINIKQWRSEYSEMFPKLTELQLWGVKSQEEAKLTEILCSFHAPKLYSLGLELDHGLLTIITKDKLVSWLQRFPEIRNFDLQMHYGKFSGREDVASVPNGSICSLKSLIIHQDFFQVNVGTLQCFPSLEYLKIIGLTEHTRNENRILYNQRVWEMLPKLKEITVCSQFQSRCCGRARYGKLMKGQVEATEKDR